MIKLMLTMRHTYKVIISSLLVGLSIFTGLSLAQASQAVTAAPIYVNRPVPTGLSTQVVKALTNPTFNHRFNNGVSPMENESCLGDATNLFMTFGFGSGNPNEDQAQIGVLFDNGTWYHTENGWLGIPASEEAVRFMLVNVTDGTIISPDDLMAHTAITMYDDAFTEIDRMQPVNVDGYFVEYSCNY